MFKNSSSHFQIQQLWGKDETVESHHGTWEHKNISWLWPENKPIPKVFRGEIHKLHFEELEKTDWTREKVIWSTFSYRNLCLTFVAF